MMIFEPVEKFRLSEHFLEKYRGKQPDWGPVGYITYKRCVSIETPILTRDLNWISAGDIKEGEKIIAFDEYPLEGNKGRCIKIAEITNNNIEEAECVEISLSSGEKLVCTPDHSWLVKKASNKLVWIKAKDLLYGKTKDCYMLRYFNVWKKDTSFEGGFLSAAFDSEGNLDRHYGLGFTQNDNELLERVKEYLEKFDFKFTCNIRKSTINLPKEKQCYDVRIYGQDQIAKFLGSFRPPRLLKKYIEVCDDIQLKRNGSKNKEELKVISVKSIGKRKIAVISTSLKTHFTGGFPSHNTYARDLINENRKEKFWETCKRVVEGCFTIQLNHCKNIKLPWNAHKAQRSAQEMFSLMWDFKFLPPGRGLWAMGSEVLWIKGSAALNNCAFVSTREIGTADFSEPFRWTMDMSMLGVGVGFDVKGAGQVTIKTPKVGDYIHTVEDSKEGWCELVRVVLESYVGKDRLPKEIDYSQVRLAGAPIKTFGGTAPGPEPLKLCVKELKMVLDKRIDQPITSSDIADIFNIIGKCVVSGGIRRSSLIALGYPDDEEYVSLKDPEKNAEYLKLWRWSSNNSIFAEVGMNYKELAKQTAKNGEPGFVYLDNMKKYGRMKDGITWADELVEGVNPCAEQSLEPYELCCLVETFPSRHENSEDYIHTLKYAYMYAKTVTLVPTHSERTNQVMLRNRRIGLSMSGITNAIDKFGRRQFLSKFCDEGYGRIMDLDKKYSRWLCVPESIKKTTVKPSGTVALLPGVDPGIHYSHAYCYIRRIRIDKNSKMIPILQKACVPNEVTKYNDNTVVFELPIKTENFYKSKEEVTIWEQMQLHADIQYYWADNNISQTVTFKEHEAKDIESVLETFEDKIKVCSFLPLNNHGYVQAPLEEITEEEYDKRNSDINWKAIKFDKLKEVGRDEVSKNKIKFCDGENCELDPSRSQEK